MTSPNMATFLKKVNDLASPPSERAMAVAGGMAAKEEAFKAATLRLGADRAMSHYKGGDVALSAGFDMVSGKPGWILVKHRPGGLWMLADRGRVRSGTIYPRTSTSKGGRKGNKTIPGRAVKTPWGPRASSSYSRSRGTGVLRLAAARERAEAPKAAHVAFQREAVFRFGMGS